VPVRINCRLQACVVRRRIVHAAAQITHKTLTPLRQGSMAHVFDQDFSQRTAWR